MFQIISGYDLISDPMKYWDVNPAFAESTEGKSF